MKAITLALASASMKAITLASACMKAITFASALAVLALAMAFALALAFEGRQPLWWAAV